MGFFMLIMEILINIPLIHPDGFMLKTLPLVLRIYLHPFPFGLFDSIFMIILEIFFFSFVILIQ